jgi:hypothetical protein
MCKKQDVALIYSNAYSQQEVALIYSNAYSQQEVALIGSMQHNRQNVTLICSMVHKHFVAVNIAQLANTFPRIAVILRLLSLMVPTECLLPPQDKHA